MCCVAVLKIFECLLGGDNGKLNRQVARSLQETKIDMKKINEPQNVMVKELEPQLVQISTMLCLQKCVWSLQYLFFSSRKFSLQKLGKNGSQIWLSFFRNSSGSVLPAPGRVRVCRHVGSHTNDNLSWAAGMSSKEFPFKEAHKLVAVMSRCDSAVYLILI